MEHALSYIEYGVYILVTVALVASKVRLPSKQVEQLQVVDTQ